MLNRNCSGESLWKVRRKSEAGVGEMTDRMEGGRVVQKNIDFPFFFVIYISYFSC